MNYKRASPIFLFCVICGMMPSLSVKGEVIDTLNGSFKLAYNSSLIYPGARAGVECPIRKKIVFKKDTDAVRYTRLQLLSMNLGWYHHPYFHDNIYLTLGYTWRKVHASGYFTEISPEVGYSRTFIGATTYEVDADGNVYIDHWAGYNYALVSFGRGWGFDFSLTKNVPLALFGKLNLLCMFPYNSTLYFRPAVEIGFIYTPKRFLHHVVYARQVYR